MQREIKFRAWDSGDILTERKPAMLKVIGLGSSIEGILCESSETIGAGILKVSSYRIMLLDPPVMQYTGLKDKNEKKIYEGDIVKTQWRDQIGIVKFTMGSFKLMNGLVVIENLSTLEKYKWEQEIIGNIYENPELLQNVLRESGEKI